MIEESFQIVGNKIVKYFVLYFETHNTQKS